MHINTCGLACHNTKSSKNHLLLYRLQNNFFILILELHFNLVFSKIFITRLHNKCTIVGVGTGYPSYCTPVGVPILKWVHCVLKRIWSFIWSRYVLIRMNYNLKPPYGSSGHKRVKCFATWMARPLLNLKHSVLLVMYKWWNAFNCYINS